MKTPLAAVLLLACGIAAPARAGSEGTDTRQSGGREGTQTEPTVPNKTSVTGGLVNGQGTGSGIVVLGAGAGALVGGPGAVAITAKEGGGTVVSGKTTPATDDAEHVARPNVQAQTVPDYSPLPANTNVLNSLIQGMVSGQQQVLNGAQHGEPPRAPDAPLSPNEIQAMKHNAAAAEAAGQNGPAALYSLLGGQPEKAEEQASKALGANANDPNALTAMMLVRRGQGRAGEAAELARRALAVDPDNPVAKLVAGHAESLAHGEALEKKLSKIDFGKAADPGALGGMGAAPGGAGGRLGASQASGAQAPTVAPAGGQAPTAAAAGTARPAPPVYDAAQPLTPAQQLVIRAVRRHEIGDEQGAMLALTQAVDQDPKEAGAFVVRAEVDNALRKYAEAVIDATRAVELAPTKPVLGARALRARAYAHLETKQWVEALADASRAVELDPQNGLGYLYRAMAEDKLGRGGAAAEDLAQAVKLDPALTPLAKPLMAKYGLQPGGGAPKPADRRVPVVFGLVGAAGLLLAFGLRRLFLSPRLTTTAAKRLAQSTPTP